MIQRAPNFVHMDLPTMDLTSRCKQCLDKCQNGLSFIYKRTSQTYICRVREMARDGTVRE